MSTAVSAQLTAVIATADRPKSLNRLLRSLKRYCPQLRTLVADSSQEPRPRKDVDYFPMPSGTGRSASCNALLARVRTPYFLLLDDRCELHRETNIERLEKLLAADKLDIAAGDLIGCTRRFWLLVRRRSQPQHAMLEFSGQDLKLQSGHRTASEGFLWCDLVHNFFIARTEKVRALGGWDPELHNDEREEFFVRAHRQGLRVGIVPEVTTWLWNEKAEVELTGSAPDRKSLAVAKMGLTRMTDFDGQVTKAPRRVIAA